MAITTYAELQAAAANWLVRSDLTARLPEYIALAEARLNRVLRHRLAEANVTTSTVIASRAIALPAAYSEALNVWIDLGSGREELRFVDPARLETYPDAGQPSAWTIDGAGLAFERPADRVYSIILRYLAKYALSTAAPTNSLLTEAPDIYLFATLCEAAPALRDADMMSAYEGRLTRAIKELNAKDARSRSQQRLSSEPAQMIGRRGGFNVNRGW